MEIVRAAEMEIEHEAGKDVLRGMYRYPLRTSTLE